MANFLTKDSVQNAQKSWGDGIIKIGEAYTNNTDYKTLAEDFVRSHYGYDEGTVLFKPTIVSLYQFRLTGESAVSYLIGGNPEFPRDIGFALKPWITVRFENIGFLFRENHTIVMGNYFFGDLKGNEKKVEFTLGYFCTENGNLKINLHHSSLPYSWQDNSE